MTASATSVWLATSSRSTCWWRIASR